MGQASIMMTLAVAAMGVAWYGMETGMIGEPPPPEAIAEAATDLMLSNAEVALQAKADKALLDLAGGAD